MGKLGRLALGLLLAALVAGPGVALGASRAFEAGSNPGSSPSDCQQDPDQSGDTQSGDHHGQGNDVHNPQGECPGHSGSSSSSSSTSSSTSTSTTSTSTSTTSTSTTTTTTTTTSAAAEEVDNVCDTGESNNPTGSQETLGDALADGIESSPLGDVGGVIQNPGQGNQFGPLSGGFYTSASAASPLNIELACLINVVYLDNAVPGGHGL